MADESMKAVWERINNLTDRVAQADKTAALTAEGLSRHLDECQRQHEENRQDRAEMRQDVLEGFAELKGQVTALQKQSAINADVAKAIEDLKARTPTSHPQGVVVPVKWILWVIAAMIFIVAGLSGVKTLPGVPLAAAKQAAAP